MRKNIDHIGTEASEFFEQMFAESPSLQAEWERTSFARAVANEIVRYRIEHGLSQSALARRLGVSQPVIGRLELGEHEPKISTLQRLSQELGLTFTVTIQPATGGHGPITQVAVHAA